MMGHLHDFWQTVFVRKCDPMVDGLSLPTVFFIIQAGCVPTPDLSSATLVKDTMRRTAFAAESVSIAIAAHEYSREVHDAAKSDVDYNWFAATSNSGLPEKFRRYADEDGDSSSDSDFEGAPSSGGDGEVSQ